MIYAVVENGRVANLIVADEVFIFEQNLEGEDVTEMEPRPEIGDLYNFDGTFSKPVIDETETL